MEDSKPLFSKYNFTAAKKGIPHHVVPIVNK